MKITPEQQQEFVDWDWMCEEMRVEHEKHQELIASGEIRVCVCGYMWLCGYV